MPEIRNDEPARRADEKWGAAYRRAHYRVNDFSLRIGRPHPEFDTWLTRAAATHYLILTAHNPYSTPLPSPVNAARHATLLALLDARGYRYVAASGHDPAGSWPAEHGVCLLDAPEWEGPEIGRLFEQHALVEGRRGGSPKLLWL